MDRVDFARYARAVQADPLVAAIREAAAAQGLGDREAGDYAAKVKLMADEDAVAKGVGRKLTQAEKKAVHVRLLRGMSVDAAIESL